MSDRPLGKSWPRSLFSKVCMDLMKPLRLKWRLILRSMRRLHVNVGVRGKGGQKKRLIRNLVGMSSFFSLVQAVRLQLQTLELYIKVWPRRKKSAPRVIATFIIELALIYGQTWRRAAAAGPRASGHHLSITSLPPPHPPPSTCRKIHTLKSSPISHHRPLSFFHEKYAFSLDKLHCNSLMELTILFNLNHCRVRVISE